MYCNKISLQKGDFHREFSVFFCGFSQKEKPAEAPPALWINFRAI